MHKYFKRIRVLMFVLVIVTVSCEKEVVLDLYSPAESFLIVEGDIDDRLATQWIRLTSSSSYYDQTPAPPVSNAMVTISDGETDYYFRESREDSLKGYYLNSALSSNLKEGIYYLKVEIEEEIYNSQSEFKTSPVIDSVTFDLNIFSRLGITADTIFDISIHFTNIDGNDIYFLTNLYINGRLRTVRPQDKTIFRGEDLTDYVSLAVNTIERGDIDDGDLVTVEIRSISMGQYDFYNDFFSQTSLSGNPFAGAPPANIPTNLSEGALGFFQVSSSQIIEREFTSSWE
ncbi:MAG: DUF4249 family protein [Bacteroidales bacterium]